LLAEQDATGKFSRGPQRYVIDCRLCVIPREPATDSALGQSRLAQSVKPIWVDTILVMLIPSHTIILAGSGISTLSPANLPPANLLLKAVIETHLAGIHSTYVSMVIEHILPEVFYEELRTFVGGSALLPFHALASPDAKPTTSHFLLVAYAFLNSVPIITTNFDTLFEQACERLGIQYIVTDPQGSFMPSGPTTVAIWKVHGSLGQSVDALSRLHATMPRIAQPNLPFLNSLAEALGGHTLALVSYSGRDLDIFPHLRLAVGGNAPIQWYDVNPNNVRNRAQSINAALHHTNIELPIIQDHPDTVSFLAARGVRIAPARADQTSIDNRLDEARTFIKNAPYQLTALTRELLLARCLFRIGKAGLAYDYLDPELTKHLSSNEAQDRFNAHITMTHLCDAVSRYDESYRHAEAALREASSYNESWAIAGRVRAMHGLDMAAKMRVGPGINIPEVSFRGKIGPIVKLRLLSRYAWTGHRMKALMRSLENNNCSTEPWMAITKNRYLDHKVVFWSMIASQRAMRPFRRLLASRFAEIARLASNADCQAADVEILAHCAKETNKIGMPLTCALEFAAIAYDLIGDPINRALLHREAGMRYLRDGDEDAARREFETMLDLSLDCGNAATVLKAAMLVHKLGGTMDRNRVYISATCITGQGYQRFAKAICHLLT
jgi:hypothetical protein